jgi:hypothetical protein
LEQAAAGREIDLEAWELGLRQVVLAAGARALEKLLEGLGCGRQNLRCDCGSPMQSRGREPKTILTVLGQVTINRSAYECTSCATTRFPADELLDIEDTEFSPGCRRLMARAGSNSPFADGAKDLWEYAHIRVNPKQVERVAKSVGASVAVWQIDAESKARADPEAHGQPAPIKTLYVEYDGTGVPVAKRETEGRKGKQQDGSAKTREAFLGCIFTSTVFDEKGYPIRDRDSTTYVGGIIPSDEFGPRIYGESLRRGMAAAERVVVIADGAKKNWAIAERFFERAIWIVDLYHAREHLYALLRILAPDSGLFNELKLKWLNLLDQGKIEELIAAANMRLPEDDATKESATKEVNYFRNNIERMRYADFRAKGLFVGNGVMEAGCKSLVGKRLKQPGMFWSVEGANSILALRAANLSDRIEDYWAERVCREGRPTDRAATRAA